VSGLVTTPYETGTKVRLVGKFQDFAGVAGSPTAVVLKVRDPAGVQTAPAVTDNTQAEDGVSVEVGTYFGDVSVGVAGVWLYRFEGTGLIEVADEEEFYVDDTPFT